MVTDCRPTRYSLRLRSPWMPQRTYIISPETTLEAVLDLLWRVQFDFRGADVVIMDATPVDMRDTASEWTTWKGL